MEEQLFLYLRTLAPDLIRQSYQYEVYDCHSKEYNTTLELKCRQAHYDDLLIEKKKYDALLERSGNVRYVCQTPKGIFSFDLRKIPEPNWIMERYPKSTYSDDGYVDKWVGYINISQAKKLD